MYDSNYDGGLNQGNEDYLRFPQIRPRLYNPQEDEEDVELSSLEKELNKKYKLMRFIERFRMRKKQREDERGENND